MTKPNEENPRGVSRSAGEDRTKTRGGIVCSHDTYAPGNNGSEAVVDQKGWGQFARAIRPIRLGAEKKSPQEFIRLVIDDDEDLRGMDRRREKSRRKYGTIRAENFGRAVECFFVWWSVVSGE